MKKYIVLLGSWFMLSISMNAQTDTIARRIVLIGDAGQLTDGRHPVVDAVRNNIPLDKKTTILFLGDNLYKHGLPDVEYAGYGDSKAVLDSQISIARGTKAKVIMIPGNHDWHNGNRDGYEAIIREQLYVDFAKVVDSADVKFQPEDGCPGPVTVNIGDNILLVIYDSQWWLHPYDKPGIESDCDCKTEIELVSRIRDIATQNTDKMILVASHHPFKSNGVHGGVFTFKQHMFPFTDLRQSFYIPLPVLGSIYVIARSVFGAPQDLKHPTYVNMINQITGAIETSLAPNVIFASGHEHNLQHIKDEKYHYIVSGGGCKHSRISKRNTGLFNSTNTGFAVLEISTNKNVNLSIYTVTDSVRKEYTSFLLNYTTPVVKPIDSTQTPVVLGNQELKFKDTVNKPASTTLPVISGLKKYIMGQNYRKEWSTPVNMKVLDLRTEKGGLTIENLGGGQQTRSLRLKDKSGREWVLRGVNKNIGKALPEEFKGTAAAEFAPELNSAAHPYGALIVPALAKPLNILTANPELFFVPDDPNLGIYRLLFANTVCLLEQRRFALAEDESKSTSKIFNEILEDNDHRPDQPKVLTARFLDILIGDFDRHFDQWRWGIADTGKGKLYYPIPRDRDQAFFNSEGKIFRAVTGRELPFLKGFRKNIHEINWLGYTAKDFDRIFLTGLDEGHWKRSVEDFRQQLSDSVIRNAIQKLPSEIFTFNGEKIIRKLISRRNQMDKEVMKYYRFLSRQVNVVGSNQKEYFKVSNYGEGLQVRVYEKGKANDTSFVMYSRIFNPSVTKEIRLFGLNDEDVFDIEENASSRIKIRIIGGKDNDTFNIRGNVKNIIYDKLSDVNVILNKSHTKNRFSADPPSTASSILGYQYNTTKFPQLLFSYNSDDGYMLGAGISKTTYGFINLPYATHQQLSALYALNRKAFQIKYNGVFNHITRDKDLIVNINYLLPALRNFTGFGNETLLTNGNNFNYYRSRYKSLEIELLMRKRIFERFELMVGPYYNRYWNNFEDNAKNVLSNPRLVGLDSADVYSIKSYTGGKFVMQFDNRNNKLFPTRGIFWKNEFLATGGHGFNTNNFVKYTTDMSIYASFRDPAKLVVALGFGGGKILSKNFEFFQALSLGVDNPNIHGFRKNRYSGSSVLYGSIELKYKLFDLNSYIIPGPVGLTAFYDIGRVWMRGENSRKWHGAYGGGIYFIPFNNFILSATAGYSANERIISFNLGTKINLTF